MPFCPKCRYEYRAGVLRCPDCGVSLVANLEEQPEKKEREDQWVKLGSTRDESEFNIVKSILESHGILVWVRSGANMWTEPAPVDPLAERVVMVPASRLAEAKRVLREVSKK